MLKYQLPQLYHHILPVDVLSYKMTETKATCESCAMSPDKEKGPITYQPNLKCCTYEPYLPNYLVGAILESKTFDQPLLTKIKNRNYVLPIGAVASVQFQIEFNQRESGQFGNRADWLCPYFNKAQNNCGIWRHRGAVCTTFFCKSDAGKKGLKFWAELSDYLSYIEMALMEEALIQLDFSPRQISTCLEYVNRFDGSAQEKKDPHLSLAQAKALWNGYYKGDVQEQVEFFIKTYQIIKNLDKKAFQEAVGEQGEQLQEQLHKAYLKCH